ncbi:MAG: helicase-related protein [Acidimicrobiales bacterium]
MGAGTYAAPLRLLAHEAYTRLAASLPPGSVGLRTGEEQLEPGAPIVCCTTELAPLHGQVLVLDEVHWVDDPDRGWAWGRLLAAAEYRHHRLVGAANAEPVLRAAYGEQLEVRRHQRLVELTWDGTVDVAGVAPGSLVVAFSRKAVLALGRELQAAGKRTGVLYGALPPGARKAQIERFLAGELDVMCVTDVIGHGINLPAETVVMAETSKYDGQRRRSLHLWELAQIVGRAGRYGLAERGRAQVLRGVAGLDANASLVRQAVEAAGGARSAGPGITAAPTRPTLHDLPATDARALLAAVQAWERAAGGALAGHGWLRAASLRAVALRLELLDRERLLDGLEVDDAWRLATLSVEDDGAVVELARHLTQGGRALGRPRLRSLDPAVTTGAEVGDVLAWAEQDAARARGLAAMSRAFPSLASATQDELLAAEQAAAQRIVEVLPGAVAASGFGRCGSCGRPCPPWTERCDRCSGRGPRLPPKRGGRPPGRRR